MRYKTLHLQPFSRAIKSLSRCYRPQTPEQLDSLLTEHPLPRGAGLSYNDSALQTDGVIIDCLRLNRLLAFDAETGLVHCQAGVRLHELMTLHEDYILPVIPGSAAVTVGGAIAHDVHGKNNPLEGTLGHHVRWMMLRTREGVFKISATEHPELFYATLGGMGLTGVIESAALQLKKAPKHVNVHTQRFFSLDTLLNDMLNSVGNSEYHVAWLDLLHPRFRAILQHASPIEGAPISTPKPISLPKVPLRLVYRLTAALFNHLYFYAASEQETQRTLMAFNHPLDRFRHWNTYYGSRGFIQFQALIPGAGALACIQQIIQSLRASKATPTLCVLKYFRKKGAGILSFADEGFTIAIDFIHTDEARRLISTLNAYITVQKGRIYLAKDMLLSPAQFKTQYPNHEAFSAILKQYHCSTHSDLSHRLGITP